MTSAVIGSAALAVPIGGGGDAGEWLAEVGGDAPWAIVAPLRPGSDLGGGWCVAALSPVVSGAAVLVLRHRGGGEARVHLCRRVGRPRGVAATTELDLLLMNGGDGNLPTAEGIGRAVKTAALRIARREAGAPRPVASGLLAHDERRARLAPAGGTA